MAEDVTVCGRTSHFGDDVRAVCFRCGADVYHRPYALLGPKVCLGCVRPADLPPGSRLLVSPKTLREVTEWLVARRAQAADRDRGA